MIFDVLTEPWMGVVDKETGEVLKVGLRKLRSHPCDFSHELDGSAF